MVYPYFGICVISIYVCIDFQIFEELYNTLQNTQMREVESIKDLDRIGKENNKDFEKWLDLIDTYEIGRKHALKKWD